MTATVWVLLHDRWNEGPGKVLGVYGREAAAQAAIALLKAADVGGTLWIETAEISP